MPPAVEPHRRRRFSGRDPTEEHRASTPLELLYDLTIVVAFGTAADELAHYVAEGHAAAGVGSFAFASFAVTWAWLNYSWFASAYDTDDWLFRLATMVQMIGVVVLSLGLPQLFASIDHGDTPDNHVVVAGYVVMRTALVFLWWQVSRHDPQRTADRPLLHDPGGRRPGRLGRARHRGHPDRPDARRGRPSWSRSSSPPRSSPSARVGRHGTRTTSPSAMACS